MHPPVGTAPYVTHPAESSRSAGVIHADKRHTCARRQMAAESSGPARSDLANRIRPVLEASVRTIARLLVNKGPMYVEFRNGVNGVP